MSGDAIALQGRKVQLGGLRTVSACESGDWYAWLVIPRVGAVRISKWSASIVKRICHGSIVDN